MTGILIGLLPVVSLANDPVVYTFEGKKDPRLVATFSVIYVGTSKSRDCTVAKPTTATRRPAIGFKNYPVREENYRIQIPVYQQETDGQCGYKFSAIELTLRRKNDGDRYSRHIILDTKQKVSPIYYGRRGGIGGGGRNPLTPSRFYTDRKYFRIATETNYLCRTKFYERLNGTTFYCFMQIRDGQGQNQFIWPTKYSRVTHPELGIDEIENETFQVDFIADDQGSEIYLGRGKGVLQDYFRMPPKSLPVYESDLDNEDEYDF